jgi:hypothetical protein
MKQHHVWRRTEEQHMYRQQHRQYNFAMIFCPSYKHLLWMINMLLAAKPYQNQQWRQWIVNQQATSVVSESHSASPHVMLSAQQQQVSPG